MSLSLAEDVGDVASTPPVNRNTSGGPREFTDDETGVDARHEPTSIAREPGQTPALMRTALAPDVLPLPHDHPKRSLDTNPSTSINTNANNDANTDPNNHNANPNTTFKAIPASLTSDSRGQGPQPSLNTTPKPTTQGKVKARPDPKTKAKTKTKPKATRIVLLHCDIIRDGFWKARPELLSD